MKKASSLDWIYSTDSSCYAMYQGLKIDTGDPKISACLKWSWGVFIGVAYQGKDILFRFTIEYSALRDFGP